jgi:hypothetical protein
VDDKSLPPTVRWLSELRDRLWTSGNTGYQVLNLVISYALRDDADSEAALRRAMELVQVVWDRSASGTTAITAVVEGNGGDANHWDGVVRWVTTAPAPEDAETTRPGDVRDEDQHGAHGVDGRDLEELRADVVQLLQEVDFWTKSAGYWRALALSRKPYACDEATEG